MINFIIYTDLGKILRTGFCTEEDFQFQAKEDEFIIEGRADDIKQKVVDKKVVNKTPQEIEDDTPIRPTIPEGEKIISIKKKEWDSLVDRVASLENN